MAAIETNGLAKIYKGIGRRRAPSLDNLTLSVEEREVFGFLGRNGAGKTTTIKILTSLIKPTSGDARIFGESIRTRQSRRLVGYLPEQPYYYEYLTPRETLDFYGELQGLSAAERAKEWSRLAELLELHEIAGERIKGFSKGMRQRVGFAVALVGDPPLLILDEPMSGLDPVGRRMIRQLILRCRDEKKTVFFSSHVLSDVEQICDRAAILVRGRLVRQGRIDELRGTATPHVETVLRGLAAADTEAMVRRAEAHRHVDGVDIFTWANESEANDAVREAIALGAALVEFSAIKETLEDYFMREQERAGERGAVG